jgi:hypothetical protein
MKGCPFSVHTTSKVKWQNNYEWSQLRKKYGLVGVHFRYNPGILLERLRKTTTNVRINDLLPRAKQETIGKEEGVLTATFLTVFLGNMIE